MKSYPFENMSDEERIKKLQAMPDSEIDFSDIPPLDDEFFQRALERRAKADLRITLRIERELLESLRELAKKQQTKYQTLIKDVLRTYVKSAREAKA